MGHVFPSGTRTKEYSAVEGTLRIGVGRMIVGANASPTVVPIYHCGMNYVLKKGDTFPITYGRNMHIFVGEPMNFDKLISEYRQQGHSDREIYVAVTNKIGAALQKLHSQAMEV